MELKEGAKNGSRYTMGMGTERHNKNLQLGRAFGPPLNTFRYMHTKLLSLLIALFSFNSYAQELKSGCGIPVSEGEGLALNWYGYAGLEHEGFISYGEALVWEYSTDEHCGTEEYENELDNKNENSNQILGEVIREPGITDICQYRKIVSGNESPFEFHSNFERRIYTLKTEAEFFTIFVLKDKGAIKFDHLNKDFQECVKKGI